MMERLRTFDVIVNAVGFDARWYQDSFGDVALSGVSPIDHFCRFGFHLGRGVSRDTPQLSADLIRAATRQPRISYCTPIMHRPDDIRATLAANLTENRPHQDAVEFVLVFMDDDHDTHDWVRDQFGDDLASGYLRMIIEPPLESWHFGRAKNRHRAYAVGDIYSSLDGDNFVTLEETEQLLQVATAHQDHFVFHHFTGFWGDGSSGRVSAPMQTYRDIGYDETFMPRQYDEMDLLLSAICTDPDLTLVRFKTDNHGFSATRSRTFLERAGITPRVIEVDAPRRTNPINPKTSDYVQADRLMEAMTTFNQGLCFLKNAPTPALRDTYLKLAVDGRHQVMDALPRQQILRTLFHDDGLPDPGDLNITADQVCVFGCMKNDDSFLPAFYEHYKQLGVRHFFLVDDGSDVPIAQILPHPDVHVVRPKIGTFATAKGLWLEGLMATYLEPEHWALTLDADEFMDLPLACDDLPALLRVLNARGQDLMPALLIDMVPGPDTDPDLLTRAEQDFLTLFDHYTWAEPPVDPEYAAATSVKWAFGPYLQLSWHLDARYHGFGTLDALRKIPLIRWRPGRHLNQGFHTLHYTDGTDAPDTGIWDTDMVLSIRHFKLLKLFSTGARARMAAHVASAAQSPYHARTTANIARIFGDGSQDGATDQMQKILSLPSHPYSDTVLRRLDPREFHTMVAESQSNGPTL